MLSLLCLPPACFGGLMRRRSAGALTGNDPAARGQRLDSTRAALGAICSVARLARIRRLYEIIRVLCVSAVRFYSHVVR